MKFSVLMSVYNKEKAEYLDAALKSIIDQSLQPHEIVIVKDGPLSPELDEVINRYVSSYKIFKIVGLPTNQGLGPALREGIKNCTYDVIARADSDDVSLPDRFELQIGFFAQNPNLDILSSNIVEFDESLTHKLSERIVPESDTAIKSYIKTRSPFNHMAVMYKKTSVIDAGSYEDCPYFEDYYLWCKAYANGGTFYNIQKPLVHARGGTAMITRRGGFNYSRCIFNFQRRIYKLRIIDTKTFMTNLLIRIPVSIMPTKGREILYKRILRG